MQNISFASSFSRIICPFVFFVPSSIILFLELLLSDKSLSRSLPPLPFQSYSTSLSILSLSIISVSLPATTLPFFTPFSSSFHVSFLSSSPPLPFYSLISLFTPSQSLPIDGICSPGSTPRPASPRLLKSPSEKSAPTTVDARTHWAKTNIDLELFSNKMKTFLDIQTEVSEFKTMHEVSVIRRCAMKCIYWLKDVI